METLYSFIYFYILFCCNLQDMVLYQPWKDYNTHYFGLQYLTDLPLSFICSMFLQLKVVWSPQTWKKKNWIPCKRIIEAIHKPDTSLIAPWMIWIGLFEIMCEITSNYINTLALKYCCSVWTVHYSNMLMKI